MLNVKDKLSGVSRIGLLGGSAALALGFGLMSAMPAHPALALSQIGSTEASVAPASFADVVDSVKGAVVSVKVKVVEKIAANSEMGLPQLDQNDPMEEFFRQFRGHGPAGRSPGGRSQPHTGEALGSGFIISADGYVVTNNHVVENATEVTLTLDGGKTVPATIIGTDKKTDLALLKIKEAGSYPHVDFATAEPRVGDWVIAVGNPFGLGGTVTAGIVSARGRDIGSGPYDDYLQIDAPVNRGNSGGPTFNGQGKVVGVNTAIFSPSGGSVGIGFAIPATVVKEVIAALKEKGSVARGWIGVEIQPVSGEIAESLGVKPDSGALVAQTQDHSPAAGAGLKPGDIITAVNGEKVDGPRELARKIAAQGPDKTVELTFLRQGSEKTTSVKLGRLPSEKTAGLTPASDEGDALAALGLEVVPAGKGKDGLVVAGVDPDSIAADSGMKEGDVIVEIGGQPVYAASDVDTAIEKARKAGRKAVLLHVQSGAASRFVALSVSRS